MMNCAQAFSLSSHRILRDSSWEAVSTAQNTAVLNRGSTMHHHASQQVLGADLLQFKLPRWPRAPHPHGFLRGFVEVTAADAFGTAAL